VTVTLLITQAELEQLPPSATNLTLCTSGISDLEPVLRHAKTLEALQLDDTGVTDLAVLTRLPRLRSLSLYDCRLLRDQSALGQLRQLESLTVGFCWSGARLPLHGLEAIAGSKRLRSLSLFGWTRRTELAFLRKLTGLRSLAVSGGWVDARWLSGLRHLRALWLTRTHTMDLRPLAKLEQLEDLWVQACGVRDVRPLGALTRLTRLLLDHNRITDASPLARCRRLVRLQLDGNPVRLPPSVTQLPHLETVTPR
jgi:internalin A